MQRETTIMRHPDGSFVLINDAGDEFNPATDPHMRVWAKVNVDGRQFVVTIPVSPQLLETPEYAESALTRIANTFPVS